jgi:hypothetical protein
MPSMKLPNTWFEARITLEQIRESFANAQEEIRIASGFFTIKGWGLIREYTRGKQVYLLVGIDEPGEERARYALVKEIMRHLATGLDEDRRQSVSDLVLRLESGALFIVDARASSHHGKLYIVDRHTAINASANATGRGFLEQVESGGLYAPSVVNDFILHYSMCSNLPIDPLLAEALHEFVRSQVENFIQKFDEYFARAKDITEELLEALKQWLQLVSPWDIYLKTILALEQIKEVKTSYDKQPASYQKDMIAQALRQIREYGGSMLVASTGLGKTVMGTHIAIQLKAENLVENVIIICPAAVKKMWMREMHEASISAYCLTLHALDTEKAHDLDQWDFIVDRIQSGRGQYLLILDESHQLRNRYPHNFGNRYSRDEKKRERKAFTRINRLVNGVGDKQKIKVLLLSGSPYATEINNINNQLFLLPHTANNEGKVLFPEYFKAWKIEEPEDFFALPVTHQLTTPYVAKYFGKVDSQGRYIEYGKDKKYFPNINLCNIYFPLMYENDINFLINNQYLDLDIKNPIFRKNIVTQVKLYWGSSPIALSVFLEKILDTPGGPKELDLGKNGKSNFVVSKENREEVILPIVQKLNKMTYEEDQKLTSLLTILNFHCPSEKVIIFCERYPTACYLEIALKSLMSSIRLFSTIEQQKPSQYELKKDKTIEEGISKFAPIANNNHTKHDETYDVFIATDAFGVGINMQDASIVVNYDIAWTPIQPIQRAGRILRPWDDPRTLHLYTFIPTLETETEDKEELLITQERWKNLFRRHGESRKFTDLPVLTDNSRQEIDMPDFASSGTKYDVGSLEFDSKEAEDEAVSSYYKHTTELHNYREYAEKLGTDISSALVYTESRVQLYLLLKHHDQYHPLLYDPIKQIISAPSSEKLLDLIRCSPQTEIAIVDPLQIENLSNECIRRWCLQNSFSEEDVIRECALYLKPEKDKDLIDSLLKSD